MSAPVIDLSAWAVGEQRSIGLEVDAAFSDLGVMVIVGHGVDLGLLERCHEDAVALFALPAEVKQRIGHSSTPYRGWFGRGSQSNAASYGLEPVADLKETFATGPEFASYGADDPSTVGPNRFPDGVPGMADRWRTLHGELQRLLARLLRVCEVALDAERGMLVRRHQRAGMVMVGNWYPPLSTLGSIGSAVRIGPHTDFGTLSIVDRRPSPAGLQFDQNGRWVDVPWVPGALTVNVGDLLSYWSSDRWRSALHRIPAPDSGEPDESHASIVAFGRPAADTAVTPILGGESVLTGEWMKRRMAALELDEAV